jgi:pyruvate/2-oxoglutarate dehydrogenase complex dihydrolipoamide acyltransferase (E2) component
MHYKLVVPGPIDDVEEVRVLEWHGAPGKSVAPGELIVEVETHKAVVEIRAAHSGVLRRVLCEEGGWRKIGGPLALMSDAAGEELPDTDEGLNALAVTFAVF